LPVVTYVDPDSIHTPSSGGIAPASWFTTHESNFRSITGRVGCRIYRTASQSFGGGPFTATITLDTVDFNNGMTTSTANTIIVPASYAGKYLLNAGLRFTTPNGAGSSDTSIEIRVNGTAVVAEKQPMATGTHDLSFAATTLQSLSVADAITLVVTGSTPGSASTVVTASYPSLSAIWLSA